MQEHPASSMPHRAEGAVVLGRSVRQQRPAAQRSHVGADVDAQLGLPRTGLADLCNRARRAGLPWSKIGNSSGNSGPALRAPSGFAGRQVKEGRGNRVN